jgi:predicted nucleotidyltransferase
MSNHASFISEAIPAAVGRLVKDIQAYPSVERVILYGSRAKGTHGRFSDIDLAVVGVSDQREWTRIHQLADVDSQSHTLLKIDLVQFESVDGKVRQNITQQGKVLYERK